MPVDATKTLDEHVEASLPEAETAKPRIQSAVRTISILLAVADSPNGLRAKEIMEKLGLSRQVTYHLIHTMHGTGIIRKNERNRYVLGLAAVSIAEGFGANWRLPSILRAGFERLSRLRAKPLMRAVGLTAKLSHSRPPVGRRP